MNITRRLWILMCCAVLILSLTVTGCDSGNTPVETPDTTRTTGAAESTDTTGTGASSVSTTGTDGTQPTSSGSTAVTSGSTATQTNPSTTRRPDGTTTTTGRKKTTTTTTKKKTTTTTRTANTYTADDLFFPLHDPSLPTPKAASLAEISLSFDAAQRRVRIQLPKGMAVRLTGQNTRTYAAIYKDDVRIGRLVPNYSFPDTVPGTVKNEAEIEGVTVQTLQYVSGKDTATTYYGFVMPHENFFYTLEISSDYISQTDFAACLASLQSLKLLERNNRLESRHKEGLRIAIAGNSFIGTSCVAQQLEAMLDANQKDATVAGYSFPNITIAQIAADPERTEMLCGGNYDVLFLSGAYWAEDTTGLTVIEKACEASGTELVLFPAHNEGEYNAMLAYRNTKVKLAYWKEAVDGLLDAGIPESDLIMYDGPRHSKPLAGYCGAVMIYGMLYETAPGTAWIGAQYSDLTTATAQLVEDLTMEYIRPYFE